MSKFKRQTDLASADIGHTPTPFTPVEGCCLCPLRGESHSL